MATAQLRRISHIIRRILPRTRFQRRSMVYGGLITTAFGTSYIWSKPSALCAAHMHPHDSKSFDLLNTLRNLAPVIDANKLLMKVQEICTSQDVITEGFVTELFKQCGVSDAHIARQLFRILDWNADGKITPEEMACTFTLFQTGTKVERYRFLFKCIDLEDSKTIGKEKFRAFYTTMLEMKYRLVGIKGEREPYEWYYDIFEDDYRSIAKLRANMLVQEIFLWADQHRHGELNLNEFLHWCKRGGPQVFLLEETLKAVCDEGLGIKTPRNVFKYDVQ